METQSFRGNPESGKSTKSLAELEEELRVLRMWANQKAGTSDDAALIEKLELQIKEKRKEELQ